jgi:hypothetical protein
MLWVNRSLDLHDVSKSYVLFLGKPGVKISIWIIIITLTHISAINNLSSNFGFGCVWRIWVVTHRQERNCHVQCMRRTHTCISSGVSWIIIGIPISCKTLTKCSIGLRAHSKVKLTCSHCFSESNSSCCVTEFQSIPKKNRCDPTTSQSILEVVVIVVAKHASNIGDVIVHSYVEHQNWISQVACKVSLENIPSFNG